MTKPFSLKDKAEAAKAKAEEAARDEGKRGEVAKPIDVKNQARAEKLRK